MAKQIWKPGNMIYPLPAVMVSVKDRSYCLGLSGAAPLDGMYYSVDRNGLYESGDGLYFSPTIPLFLWNAEKNGRVCY